VAVKIKLKRLGKIRAPYYRIVIADSRTKRDGRAIEEIGKYHPKADPSFIEVDSERAQHWLKVGAQPTDPVRKILEVTGDWQKFKGLPGAEGTLRTAEPKADKKAAFDAAVAESLQESGAKTTKPKGRAADTKTADAKADKPAKAADGKADKPAKATEARATEAKAAGAKAADAKAPDAKADKPAKAEAKADGAKADKPATAAKAAKSQDDAPAAEAPASAATAVAEAPAAEEAPAAAEEAPAAAEDASDAAASTEAASAADGAESAASEA
jgi:small subunit ribosomal protein S16